jgi:hypothetical protein
MVHMSSHAFPLPCIPMNIVFKPEHSSIQSRRSQVKQAVAGFNRGIEHTAA